MDIIVIIGVTGPTAQKDVAEENKKERYSNESVMMKAEPIRAMVAMFARPPIT